MEKEKVLECSVHYNDMVEQYHKERKEEKATNDLLSKLPDSTSSDVGELERII